MNIFFVMCVGSMIDNNNVDVAVFGPKKRKNEKGVQTTTRKINMSALYSAE